jgi:biopolymer transport protein ExbB
MKRSAMALLTAAAMLLTGVSCAKKGGSSKVSEKENSTDAPKTTAIIEEETKEMATEHKSPVETVSASLGSQISVNRVIGRAEGSNTIKFPLADLIEEGDRIESFTFTVYSGDGGNIGEFKGGCGISVDDKCPAATNKGWYQSGDFSAPTEGSYGEITWNVPEELKDYIHEGKIKSAAMLCQRYDSPIARLVEKGIERIGRPLGDIQTSVENTGNVEVARLERGLPFLATIAGGAPMIGFLGTVIGMVQAFFDMANTGNNIDITLLSNGIYTAMITTVGGLIVGILAYFGYNYLTSKISDVVFTMENATIGFMDVLNDPESAATVKIEE